MTKRIAITGLGIVDPLGYSPDECFDNLVNDYDPHQDIKQYNIDSYPNIPVTRACSVDYAKLQHRDERSDPYIQLATHAVEQALADSKHTSKNAAVIFSSLGTSAPSRYSLQSAIESGKRRYSPRSIMENIDDYISGHISRTHEFTGLSTGMNAACATGLISLDYAVRIVNDYDFVVVGGADSMIDTMYMYSFNVLQALSQTYCRPFGADRDGFDMGEGAGCIIIETEERALARGAHIYGYIDGIAVANDYYSVTSPDPEGRGAELAMQTAWERAGCPNIDFVNAHATGTVAGDDVEYAAIRRLFKDAAIYSSKGKIGHTMAGCGIIELIHGISTFKYGVIPRTFNLSNKIADDELLLTQNLAKTSQVFIKNSFGFGGRCASVVVSKD